MHILIRLPNWLGDMVMSVAFVKEVHRQFPGNRMSLIVKKGLHPLLPFFPPFQHSYVFSKEEYKGLAGLYRFGKVIRQQGRPDLFFSLPDSFSSAFLGWSTGAKKRVGYKNELRSIFLTHFFHKKETLHRVEQYLDMLSQFTGKMYAAADVSLKSSAMLSEGNIIVNFNSEASSRRMPLSKAILILEELRKSTDKEIILIGGSSDISYTSELVSNVSSPERVTNLAGKTSLEQLIHLALKSSAVLSTDSGPAHVANALKIPTVVLFGAGNEYHTAPYNKSNSPVIRLGQLPCEPCVSNVCKLYGSPRCLESLDSTMIVQRLLSIMR